MQPNQKAEKLLIESASSIRSEIDRGLYRHMLLVLTSTKCTRLLPAFIDSPVWPKIAQTNAVHTEQSYL